MAGSITALGYHDATKHHFNRYARSLGYLDWALQPDPFRRYAGAPRIELPRPAAVPDTPYADLYRQQGTSVPLDLASLGTLLRFSLGLSAWKQYGESRWALRVNPSSGNLHPTEAYVAWNGRVCHYAPLDHELEARCANPAVPADVALVALTSIPWREAWKYGERAFRYCQHDTGHAIAALRLAAAMLGWHMALLPRWTAADIAALVGTDRALDFPHAELEEPECLAVVGAANVQEWVGRDPAPLVTAAQAGTWSGVANRLSADHHEWPLIAEVARATRPGRGERVNAAPEISTRLDAADRSQSTATAGRFRAADVILKRRSALGYDPRGVLRRESFLAMLSRLQPGSPPWDAIEWPPQVHLALFVHRVQDVVPGLYAYVRDPGALAELRAAMRPEFLWEPVPEPLFLLAPIDVRATANRLSCNQDIAEDGFFSLGMLARFEANLQRRGESFYRNLFWETGIIGQVLYLEAEAAGARGTGIGCFFDDPVHEVLGLRGHTWQSLYHFSVGLPVDDGRLTTEPGYAWETVAQPPQ